MPSVRFRRTAPKQTGDAPATGFFRFSVTKPVTIPGDPDDVITTAPFKAVLIGGAADVELAPTGLGWAWQVFESIDGIPDVTYFVTVPDVPGPLDDGDLTRVNPSTLSPRAQPEAAWWAVANATITDAAVIGDDLILTRHDGSTVNAGRVTPTPEAFTAAAAAAVDAELDVTVDASVDAKLSPAVDTAVAAAVGPAAAAAVAAAATPGALTFLTDTDGRPYIA